MKVYIWGTGKIAKRYLVSGEIEKDNIIGFIETKKTKESFEGIEVFEPTEIVGKEYDFIIVCMYGFSVEIYRVAVALLLDIKKMIFVDNWTWLDGNSLRKTWPQTFSKKVFEEQNNEAISKYFPVLYSDFILPADIYANRYTAVLKNGFDLVDRECLLGLKEFDERIYKEDYTRYRTFELVANEIISSNIQGCVAELGVFKGTFSRLINSKFKTRKMYLFDTFGSFDINEFKSEVEAGRCKEDFIDVFKETSIEAVLDRMLYPENIEIKRGFFPDSLNGMPEEKYCFVSIDVDLEKSILEGLRYFYPRLNEGGAIFIHDYNNCFLEGVKEAVKIYEQETNKFLIKVPLCDEGGTLVVCK